MLILGLPPVDRVKSVKLVNILIPKLAAEMRRIHHDLGLRPSYDCRQVRHVALDVVVDGSESTCPNVL